MTNPCRHRNSNLSQVCQVGNRVKAWGCTPCISCFWNACVLVLHSHSGVNCTMCGSHVEYSDKYLIVICLSNWPHVFTEQANLKGEWQCKQKWPSAPRMRWLLTGESSCPQIGLRKAQQSYSMLPFSAFLCFILQMLGVSSTEMSYLRLLESKVTGCVMTEKGWHSLSSVSVSSNHWFQQWVEIVCFPFFFFSASPHSHSLGGTTEINAGCEDQFNNQYCLNCN